MILAHTLATVNPLADPAFLADVARRRPQCLTPAEFEAWRRWKVVAGAPDGPPIADLPAGPRSWILGVNLTPWKTTHRPRPAAPSGDYRPTAGPDYAPSFADEMARLALGVDGGCPADELTPPEMDLVCGTMTDFDYRAELAEYADRAERGACL